MSVDPSAIRVVLDESPDPKAKTADPKRFYDNALIEAVNRDYASRLFPGDVRRLDGKDPSVQTHRFEAVIPESQRGKLFESTSGGRAK
jgi:hypothetical protein